MSNALTEAAGTITGRKPGYRERAANALQDLIERVGIDRPTARKWAQSVAGGESSNLPGGVGLVDATGLGALLDYADNPDMAGAMFVGPLSKTWNKAAAAKAEALEKAGKDARSIWKETGTLRGPEGLLRQEIDDSKAVLTPQAQQVFTPGVVNADRKFDVMLPDALKHQAFTDAYPMPIGVKATNDPGGASFASGASPFASDGTYRTVKMSKAEYEPKSTLLHELQHAIQQREGWARGGSPDAMQEMVSKANTLRDKINAAAKQMVSDPDPIARSNASQEFRFYGQQLAAMNNPPKDAQEAYRRLAGEAEARATQARMNLTAEQRRARFPYDDYDVPLDQLIVRKP